MNQNITVGGLDGGPAAAQANNSDDEPTESIDISESSSDGNPRGSSEEDGSEAESDIVTRIEVALYRRQGTLADARKKRAEEKKARMEEQAENMNIEEEVKQEEE